MISEVIPCLYIGDFADTQLWTQNNKGNEFLSINVAYEHEKTLPDSLFLPWFIPTGNGQVQISQIVLNALAEIIDLSLAAGKKVLVNCNMGMERSPLTVVWFLMKKRGMTFDEAYELVKKQRPQTLDRRQWVEPFLKAPDKATRS